jgi:hypothetical protein
MLFELKAELAAAANDPVLKALSDARNLSAPVRDRLELQAKRPQDAGFADTIGPVKPGQTVTLRVRVAGDGMVGAAVTYGLTGPGSLGAVSGTTDTQGEAQFTYAAGAAPTATATVSATFDGTTNSLALTIRPGVTVAVSPATVTVAPGGTVQFAATVGNASDLRVGWGASGGSINQNGLYTAGSTPGTFAVSVVSVEDPSASDTATVTIGAATFEGYWVGDYRNCLECEGRAFADARIFAGATAKEIELVIITQQFGFVFSNVNIRARAQVFGSTFAGSVYGIGGSTWDPSHPLAPKIFGSLTGGRLTIRYDRPFVGQDGVTIFVHKDLYVFELMRIG